MPIAVHRMPCFSIAPTLEDIEAIAAEALATIPEEFRRHVGNVRIQVDDFPSDEVEKVMELDTPFDLLGLYQGRAPRFVKRYADLATEIRDALERYAADVRERRFPEEQHTYSIPDEELADFKAELAPENVQR